MSTSEKPWSEQDQQTHIKTLKVKAAALRTTIDTEISKLLVLTQEFDPLDLLAKLATYQLFGSPEFEQHHTKERSESQVEYLQSLVLAQPYPDNPKWPAPGVVQKSFDLVEGILMRATLFHGLSSSDASKDDVGAWLRACMMIQALHLRGDSYSVHTIETFVAIVQPHAGFLEERFRFSSADFLHAIRHAENSINAAMTASFRDTMGMIETLVQASTERPQSGRKTCGLAELMKSSAEVEAIREKHGARFDQWREQFDQLGGPSIFRVVPDSEITARIYEWLSLEFGQNAGFLEKFPKWSGWPLNPSAIYARPLVRHEGHYYLFHVPLAERNALKLLEELIRETDEAYWQQSFLPKRDKYVESTSLELLTKLLPGCQCFSSLFYDCFEDGLQKRAEVDGLLIFDDTLLIVEAKASKFTDEARRGAIKRLKSDLDAIIDKAYQQAHRVLDLLRSTPEVPFLDEAGNEILRLRVSRFVRVFLVSVSLEKLSSLSTGLFALRKLGLIQGREWPWSVALNDLRILAEINEHPTIFLHYLTRRIACNAFEQLSAADELDMFAHYMQRGLYFEGDERFQSAALYILDSHTKDIDRYYASREGCLPGVPKPKIEMPPRFEELLTTLETVRPKNFVTACLALLDFDDQTRTKIASEIDQIDEAGQQGRMRIVALPLKRSGSALILGCGNINTPDENRILRRCHEILDQENLPSATAIMWRTPGSLGNLKVFLLHRGADSTRK